MHAVSWHHLGDVVALVGVFVSNRRIVPEPLLVSPFSPTTLPHTHTHTHTDTKVHLFPPFFIPLHFGNLCGHGSLDIGWQRVRVCVCS